MPIEYLYVCIYTRWAERTTWHLAAIIYYSGQKPNFPSTALRLVDVKLRGRHGATGRSSSHHIRCDVQASHRGGTSFLTIQMHTYVAGYRPILCLSVSQALKRDHSFTPFRDRALAWYGSLVRGRAPCVSTLGAAARRVSTPQTALLQVQRRIRPLAQEMACCKAAPPGPAIQWRRNAKAAEWEDSLIQIAGHIPPVTTLSCGALVFERSVACPSYRHLPYTLARAFHSYISIIIPNDLHRVEVYKSFLLLEPVARIYYPKSSWRLALEGEIRRRTPVIDPFN